MRNMRTCGRVVTVEIEKYDECKYTASRMTFENSTKLGYSGVTKWEIVEGEDAKEIESNLNRDCMDDFHEYLVLYFEDGETATFRNSYVDMFVF